MHTPMIGETVDILDTFGRVRGAGEVKEIAEGLTYCYAIEPNWMPAFVSRRLRYFPADQLQQQTSQSRAKQQSD